MSMSTKLIVLGLFIPSSSAFVASSPSTARRSPWLQHHGGPRPRALPSMADSSEVAVKRLLLEAAFAKGELKEANKRLKILLMQTTAAKGAVAGVVAVTASAVAAGSGVVLLLGRAVLIAAAAAAAAGIAEAMVEFLLCLDPDQVEGDSSEALVINSGDLTLWTVVIISAWRTQARRLPGAYMDALKAQFEAHPPGLPSLADQSEGGRLEAAAKRQAASTEEGLAEVKHNCARIKRALIVIGAMVGLVVGEVVVDVHMLAAMASAAVGAQVAVPNAVGWAVAVATVGTTGLVAGARAAEFFDFPFQNLLLMDEEEQVRSSPP